MTTTRAKRTDAAWTKDLATLTTLANRCGEVHQSYSDFVMLGALLAARGSEISGLQVGDIDWDQRIVTIRRQTYPGAGGLVTKQTKGRDIRHVPILQALTPVLERLTHGRESDERLLTGPRGGVLTTASVRDATKWDQLVTELELPSLTRHGLRHTGATWLADAGIPLHVLQGILGHKSIETTRAEARSTNYLPRGGEPGAAALRSYRGFRVPAHQDTSAALQGAYPFLAEGGLGSQGVFVGQDMYSGGSFVYDPWVLYQRGIITAPNLVLAGIVGSGKSSLAKSLYTRSIPFGRRVYVPGDPKGEHTAVAEAVGGKAIVLGHGLRNRLNPLDEGYRPAGISDNEWTATVASRRRDLIGALAETVLERSLTPLEHTAIDIALQSVVSTASVPILPMIVDRILAPDTGGDDRLADDGRMVGHALRRLVSGDLAGLFDGPSTVSFDPTLPMITLDLSRVVENSTLISVLMTCSSAWMESALLDPNGGQRWVVYDEAWRLMSHPALLKRMDAHWRLARHYGIANLLIFHKLTDLDNVGDQGSAMRSLATSLLANAESRIIYRQESDQVGTTGKTLGLTGTEQKLLPSLGTGQGLWRIKESSYVVQHQLHPDELRAFDTTQRMTQAQNPRKHADPGRSGDVS